jgi:hypothetical protein
MSWKAIARSAIGTSHQHQSMPCQDYGDYKILDRTIIGVVADGAGSAKYSDLGAKLTVNTVLEEFARLDPLTIKQLIIAASSVSETTNQTSLVKKSWNFLEKIDRKQTATVNIALSPNEQQARQFFGEIIARVVIALKEQAEKENYPLEDLACTLLIVIATPDGIAAMQIGDGFITVRYPETSPQLLFPPDKGEYINETTFVTSSNALTEMRVIVQPRQPEFICASTDGLERLAIQVSDWTPFAPFFNPLEQYLRETENLEESDEYLMSFLNSDRLNARTDDDKTLFLCMYDKSDSPQ